jgi:prevent-host-death family protein
MHTVTLEEAREHLAELVAEARQGGEILITEGKEPVARLSRAEAKPAGEGEDRFPLFGLLSGKIQYREGWEKTPEEFRPYME